MRISIGQTLIDHDISDEDILSLADDSIVPACCSEGCQVEPDGVCQHGCNSILIEMGVI